MISLLALLAVVNSAYTPPTYACNGVTATFTVSFPYRDRTDVVVTSTTAAGAVTTLALTTDYTVSLISSKTTAQLTLNSPATKCPAGSTLKITRVTLPPQKYPFGQQTTFNTTTLETSEDAIVYQIQEAVAVVNATLSALQAGGGVTYGTPQTITGATATSSSGTSPNLLRADSQPATLWTGPGTGAVARTFDSKFSDLDNVRDYGVLGNGTDEHVKLQAAIDAKTGTLYIPRSATCYNIGSTSLTLNSGRVLQGAGMGGAASGPTCITYTGNGCGILIDSVSFAGIRDIDVQTDTTSATARGVCLKSTSGVAEFNLVDSVSIRMINATRRTAGQIALFLNDAVGHGVFWNTIRRVRAAYWDTAVRLDGVPGNGVNANHLEDIMVWGHVTGLSMLNHSDDNKIYGFYCSRSDNSYEATVNTCLNVPDANAVLGNEIHLTNDAANGASINTVCATLGTTAGANILYANCESGGPVVDNYTGALKNEIHQQISNRFTFGKIFTSDAAIIGTTWNGVASVGSTGGAIAFTSGAADANFASGPVTIATANTAGVASPGNITIRPGNRSGGAHGGTVSIGGNPAEGQGGFRVRSSRVVAANKSPAPVDCGGAGIPANVSNILDGSIFTCATAQNLTMPTAAGAGGLVQNLPEQPAVVGDTFEFVMSSTAAANFTLVAGAGGTIVGNAVVNNSQHVWWCRVTGVGAGAETISCY